jgi:hypothetical protein
MQSSSLSCRHVCAVSSVCSNNFSSLIKQAKHESNRSFHQQCQSHYDCYKYISSNNAIYETEEEEQEAEDNHLSDEDSFLDNNAIIKVENPEVNDLSVAALSSSAPALGSLSRNSRTRSVLRLAKLKPAPNPISIKDRVITPGEQQQRDNNDDGDDAEEEEEEEEEGILPAHAGLQCRHGCCRFLEFNYSNPVDRAAHEQDKSLHANCSLELDCFELFQRSATPSLQSKKKFKRGNKKDKSNEPEIDIKTVVATSPCSHAPCGCNHAIALHNSWYRQTHESSHKKHPNCTAQHSCFKLITKAKPGKQSGNNNNPAASSLHTEINYDHHNVDSNDSSRKAGSPLVDLSDLMSADSLSKLEKRQKWNPVLHCPHSACGCTHVATKNNIPQHAQSRNVHKNCGKHFACYSLFESKRTNDLILQLCRPATPPPSNAAIGLPEGVHSKYYTSYATLNNSSTADASFPKPCPHQFCGCNRVLDKNNYRKHVLSYKKHHNCNQSFECYKFIQTSLNADHCSNNNFSSAGAGDSDERKGEKARLDLGEIEEDLSSAVEGDEGSSAASGPHQPVPCPHSFCGCNRFIAKNSVLKHSQSLSQHVDCSVAYPCYDLLHKSSSSTKETNKNSHALCRCGTFCDCALINCGCRGCEDKKCRSQHCFTGQTISNTKRISRKPQQFSYSGSAHSNKRHKAERATGDKPATHQKKLKNLANDVVENTKAMKDDITGQEIGTEVCAVSEIMPQLAPAFSRAAFGSNDNNQSAVEVKLLRLEQEDRVLRVQLQLQSSQISALSKQLNLLTAELFCIKSSLFTAGISAHENSNGVKEESKTNSGERSEEDKEELADNNIPDPIIL